MKPANLLNMRVVDEMQRLQLLLELSVGQRAEFRPTKAQVSANLSDCVGVNAHRIDNIQHRRDAQTG